MRKITICLTLLFLLMLAAVPDPGPVTYFDSEIQAIQTQDLPAEEISVFSVSDNYDPFFLVAVRQGDVEEFPLENLYLTAIVSFYDDSDSCLLYMRNDTNQNENYNQSTLLNRRHRLDIGENLPRHGEKCRHT